MSLEPSDLLRSGVPIDLVAKQLGHANSMTVSNTYGHLVEQIREEQIRKRFSPLCEVQQHEMERRKPALEILWSTLQTKDWRQYANVEKCGTLPRASYSNPVREVAELFDSAERSVTIRK